MRTSISTHFSPAASSAITRSIGGRPVVVGAQPGNRGVVAGQLAGGGDRLAMVQRHRATQHRLQRLDRQPAGAEQQRAAITIGIIAFLMNLIGHGKPTDEALES